MPCCHRNSATTGQRLGAPRRGQARLDSARVVPPDSRSEREGVVAATRSRGELAMARRDRGYWLRVQITRRRTSSRCRLRPMSGLSPRRRRRCRRTPTPSSATLAAGLLAGLHMGGFTAVVAGAFRSVRSAACSPSTSGPPRVTAARRDRRPLLQAPGVLGSHFARSDVPCSAPIEKGSPSSRLRTRLGPARKSEPTRARSRTVDNLRVASSACDSRDDPDQRGAKSSTFHPAGAPATVAVTAAARAGKGSRSG